MATKSSVSYGERAKSHPNALAKRLFEIAESKQTNITVSADLATTKELLSIAEALGPYIAVFKTHIDIISDFGSDTTEGLQLLAKKHNFLIFEDRKFIDIGNTVQKQYRGGALKIYDWAHIINASVLAGEGIIDALVQTIEKGEERDRGILILAEMTSKGSLAVGEYTRASVEIAKKYKGHVLGFVATRQLSTDSESQDDAPGEDFVIFTTGISISSKGDPLGQQYQSPASAMERGADFLIVGRGIYSGPDPVASAKAYREAGWAAYLLRLKGEVPSLP